MLTAAHVAANHLTGFVPADMRIHIDHRMLKIPSGILLRQESESISEPAKTVDTGLKLENVTMKMDLLAVKILASVHYVTAHGQLENIFCRVAVYVRTASKNFTP